MSDTPPVVDDPLFFLDYDGTLAPIVDKPMEAYPHPDVPALLQAIDAQHPVYIVTGRHISHVAELMPEPELDAIGLHGTQEGRLGGEPRSLISQRTLEAIASMRETLPEIEGVVVEEKGETFAVHYRDVADEQQVLEKLRTWVADLPASLEVIWGKKVAELRPAGSNKGVAVRRISAEHPGRTPVYLGDDVTDEDAFEALATLECDRQAVTIKVGDGPTSARYRLDGPEDVVAYLRSYTT